MLSDGDRANFETLRRAVLQDDIALVECQRVSDGKIVAVVCAANLEDGEISFVPLATLIEGNPYTAYRPPDPDGGFCPVEETADESGA